MRLMVLAMGNGALVNLDMRGMQPRGTYMAFTSTKIGERE